MLDITPADFPTLPLNPLQGRPCTREGTLELMKSVNKAMGEGGKDQAIVSDLFDRCWPDLDGSLGEARKLLASPKKLERDASDVLAEIVTNTRAILDQLRPPPPPPPRLQMPRQPVINSLARPLPELVKEFLESRPEKSASVEQIWRYLERNKFGRNLSRGVVRGLLETEEYLRIEDDEVFLID
jgi:hypothetical protein